MADTSYTTRPYRPDDWEAICRVHDAARPLELEGCCDARAFVPLDQDPEGEEIAASQVRVACDAAGKVVAFAAVDGDDIGWLYVDPAHRRRGLGRVLLREAIDIAGAGAGTTCLRDNAPARRLYESEGFVVTRTWDDENAGWPCTVVRLQRGRAGP